jgi:hypothetical protein
VIAAGRRGLELRATVLRASARPTGDAAQWVGLHAPSWGAQRAATIEPPAEGLPTEPAPAPHEDPVPPTLPEPGPAVVPEPTPVPSPTRPEQPTPAEPWPSPDAPDAALVPAR